MSPQLRAAIIAVSIWMTAGSLLAQQGEEILSSATEEERFIDRVREAAEEYAGKLPDFVCDQTTVRWWRRGDEMDWRKKDEIKAELVNSGGQEDSRNFRIDG